MGTGEVGTRRERLGLCSVENRAGVGEKVDRHVAV